MKKIKPIIRKNSRQLILFSSSAVFIFIVLIFIPSCRKDKKASCQQSYNAKTQILKHDAQPIVGRFSYGGIGRADLSSFDVLETDIDYVLIEQRLQLFKFYYSRLIPH